MSCNLPTGAVVTNLTIFLGEDKTFVDQIFEADGTTKQDVTGWDLTFTVHAYHDPSTVFITKTVGSGITLVPPTTNGVVNILIDSTDTIGIWPGVYSWKLERTDTGLDAVLSLGLFTVQFA